MAELPICIIGTGVAALALMEELRRRDAAVPITVVAPDAGHYAYRPNFSAAMDRGWLPADLVTESSARWSARLRVRLLAFTEVPGIDVDGRELRSGSGTVAYRDLVLATGSRTRVPAFALDDPSTVLVVDQLRGFTDAYPILQAAAQVAVIGAGLVGCELADDLARSGRRVTVFDAAPRPLARRIPVPLATRLMTALSQEKVQWKLGTTITGVRTTGSRRSIHYGPENDGMVVDAIVSAAGLQPNSEIAGLAGLECLPAVPVNAGMGTAQPHIHALGDVAQPPGGWRPFVAGARQGARVLAARLTGDDSTRFDGAPQPITVKTRLYPMKLLRPNASTAGQWQIEVDRPDTFVGHYLDADDCIQGFALGGEAARSHRVSLPMGARLIPENLHA